MLRKSLSYVISELRKAIVTLYYDLVVRMFEDWTGEWSAQFYLLLFDLVWSSVRGYKLRMYVLKYIYLLRIYIHEKGH